MQKVAAVFILSVLALLVAGCASDGVGGALDEDQLRAEIRKRGLDPSQVILPFSLTDEMRAWAHEAAPERLPPVAKLERLRDELLDDKRLPLSYVWGQTNTAIEVFESRQANCLSFTNLFVGMAREVGVMVSFLEVEDVRTYRKEGDLVVVSDHIAVGYEMPPDALVFDFSEHGLKDHQKVQKISDLTAIAMYYTNRGAEALQVGEIEASLDWLRQAVVLDPGLAHGWVNLGVGLRRSGDSAAAEDVYRIALEVDPRTPSAYQNLVSLLRLEGRDEEAGQFEEVLRKTPSRNPFTFLTLGDISRQSGRLAEAERLYRRAIAVGCEDAECFAALGQLAMANGKSRTARKMLKKAQRADAQNRRTMRLAEQLRKGQSADS